jgi:hypothetical protein
MGRTRGVAPALLLWAAACGSKGGQSGGTGGSDGPGSLVGDLAVVSHSPADGAIQVAVDSEVRIRFDGVIVRDCLQDEDVHLRTAAGARVAGVFVLEGAGRDVVFRPAAPLAKETDYTLALSPFVCDTRGRLLGNGYSFSFRSYDDRPPSLVTSSVANGASGVDPRHTFQLQFDEQLDPRSLAAPARLRDVYGGTYAVEARVAGSTVTLDPVVDLAGDRSYVLAVADVRDRAGNALSSPWTASFRTAPDTTPPEVTGSWPTEEAGIGASPLIQPLVTFDESVDPLSVELASVALVDEYGNIADVNVVPSPDQRVLRLEPKLPLRSGRGYYFVVLGGQGGVTDVTGNPLLAGIAIALAVGEDATPPRVVESLPAADAVKVSINVEPELTWDEPLDPSWVGPELVGLLDDRGPVAADVSLHEGGRILRLTPRGHLRPDAAYAVTVRGGPFGVRDRAGNLLSGDLRLAFRTSAAARLPTLLLMPQDGHVVVPRNAKLAGLFDRPADPATVSATTVQVLAADNSPVPGRLELSRGDRRIRFVPEQPWPATSWFRIVVRGGPRGVRMQDGSWFSSDATSQFRTSTSSDATPPRVVATLNAAADDRKQLMQVPPSGFEVGVRGSDVLDYALDIGSTEVVLTGPGRTPTGESIFAAATAGPDRLTYLLPPDARLAPGDYEVVARISDLAGNTGTSEAVRFSVVDPSASRLPFERTHAVWTRFDLDRSGNGVPDFEDDLLALGLIAAGDPQGTNQRMIAVVRDGILARANTLFGRATDGARTDAGAVSMRLTHRRPLGVPHMQIACGGNDPEGPRNRTYGADSTGVLGRAFFDMYNGQLNDLNIASNPGLGVFPGEMLLFQARIHLRVYPAYVTTFARTFLPLSPHMGGSPAGSVAGDAAVLDPSFNYMTGTPTQRARYDVIFRAADDWAAAIGVILAHEIGHSVGLVAEGPSPLGLHGDASLHNHLASATDVMASAVGYDALVLLDYSFRDLDMAYLRQRLILR